MSELQRYSVKWGIIGSYLIKVEYSRIWTVAFIDPSSQDHNFSSYEIFFVIVLRITVGESIEAY